MRVDYQSFAGRVSRVRPAPLAPARPSRQLVCAGPQRRRGPDRDLRALSVRGNNRHPRARWQASLMRALNALLLNGAPSRPGKTSADPAKSTPPPRRNRTPLTLSRKANQSSSESDNSLVRGRSRHEPPLTWRRAAIIIPPGSRTSLSIVKSAHSWYRQPVKKRVLARTSGSMEAALAVFEDAQHAGPDMAGASFNTRNKVMRRHVKL